MKFRIFKFYVFILLCYFVHCEKLKPDLSVGYGCLLKCMSACITNIDESQIRDCKVSCKRSSNSSDCLENDGKCAQLCRDSSSGRNQLILNTNLLALHIKIVSPKNSEGRRIIRLSWLTIKDAKLYVLRFRTEENLRWNYQEVDNVFSDFVISKACIGYEFQLAYVINDEGQAEMGPFSETLKFSSHPQWTHLVKAEPTELFFDPKTPFLNDAGFKEDNASIFLRHNISLPTGWLAEDFQYVGKFWRVLECKHYARLKPAFVAFSKIVAKNSKTAYIESVFPAYLGYNQCTVTNKMNQVHVCDELIALPFEIEDGSYKLKLECETVRGLKCEDGFED